MPITGYFALGFMVSFLGVAPKDQKLKQDGSDDMESVIAGLAAKLQESLELKASQPRAENATSHVVSLTDGNFQNEISRYSLALVQFYVPWCDGCTKFAVEFEKAATLLKKRLPSAKLCKVNCDESPAVCPKSRIRTFPTVKIFANGVYRSEYKGPRYAEGLVEHIKEESSPASKDIRTLKGLEAFLNETSYAVVGFFKQFSELRRVYLSVAEDFRGRYRFAHSSSEDIIDEYGYENNVVVFRPKLYENSFESSKVMFFGQANETQLTDFLENSRGLCDHRTLENAYTFPKPLLVAYYNVDYDRNTKGTRYWRNRLLTVAQRFRGRINLTFALSSIGDFQGEMTRCGIPFLSTRTVAPIVALMDENGKRFPFNETFSVSNLTRFVKNYLNGTLQPYVRSMVMPEETDSPVQAVVGKNFESMVNQDKDVMLEFCVQWSGNCNEFEFIYEQLATKLKNESGIVIAKIDTTLNEVPKQYEIKMYPTIYWIPRNAKNSPMMYTGEKTVERLIKFIAQHATQPLRKYDRNGKTLKKLGKKGKKENKNSGSKKSPGKEEKIVKTQEL